MWLQYYFLIDRYALFQFLLNISHILVSLRWETCGASLRRQIESYDEEKYH